MIDNEKFYALSGISMRLIMNIKSKIYSFHGLRHNQGYNYAEE